MIQLADRPETSTDHHQEIAPPPETSSHHHQELPPFTTLLLHDTKVDMWDNLHNCYSVVRLAHQALAYDDGGKDSPSFAASVALEMVANNLMKVINTLENLKSEK